MQSPVRSAVEYPNKNKVLSNNKKLVLFAICILRALSNGFECFTKNPEIEQFIEDIKNTGKTSIFFSFFGYETMDCFDILISLVLMQF